MPWYLINVSISFLFTVSTSLGNVLTPTQVKDQPTVEWDAEPNAFYTLCLTDPGNFKLWTPYRLLSSNELSF